MLADTVVQRLPETRPAGAALIFGFRGEQRIVATGTGEDALAMFLEQRARIRSLGAFLAQDFILLRRQLRAPFGVGLLDLEFLLGTRRRTSQPAEGSKAQESGGGRKQDTAVNHDDGLRAKRIRVVRFQIRGAETDVTPVLALISHFPASAPSQVRPLRRGP